MKWQIWFNRLVVIVAAIGFGASWHFSYFVGKSDYVYAAVFVAGVILVENALSTHAHTNCIDACNTALESKKSAARFWRIFGYMSAFLDTPKSAQVYSKLAYRY